VLKRRDVVIVWLAGASLVLALLTVFAIELSNTQAKSRRDVTARVHERAVLAAALIDSLLQTVQEQTPQLAQLYGTAKVTAATLNAHRDRNEYLVLLDARGNVLAASQGFTAQARANLARSAALRLVLARRTYGLGNLLPYGRTSAVDFAVAFPTPHGKRILLTGFGPQALGPFLQGDLRKIPGVKGAHNYVIDGNDTVLASTNPAAGSGFRFPAPARAALARSSGERRGHYYEQVGLANSTWRIVLAEPDGPLFASVSGFRKWVPWAIFAAFATVALVALALGRRAMRASAEVRDANARLGQMNDELASANAALEHRARELSRSNAELEQFASIASHDLQEPLRKVRTFTDQVVQAESEQLSPKGRDYLERAAGAAERMQALIEDLLKYSRVGTHGRSFAPVNMTELTRGVLEDLESSVERSGASVHVGELPTVDADAPQMRQLMQNLVSNALKFRRPDVEPEIVIEGHADDGTATIKVVDNGIGFDPQYSGRIFRVFERLHSRAEYPGTGIGLALCRKIAERHGGAVVAESMPGEGSTFTVILPLHHRDGIDPGTARDAPRGVRHEPFVPA
jgi:signal transduction histidine kinase